MSGAVDGGGRGGRGRGSGNGDGGDTGDECSRKLCMILYFWLVVCEWVCVFTYLFNNTRTFKPRLTHTLTLTNKHLYTAHVGNARNTKTTKKNKFAFKMFLAWGSFILVITIWLTLTTWTHSENCVLSNFRKNVWKELKQQQQQRQQPH